MTEQATTEAPAESPRQTRGEARLAASRDRLAAMGAPLGFEPPDAIDRASLARYREGLLDACFTHANALGYAHAMPEDDGGDERTFPCPDDRWMAALLTFGFGETVESDLHRLEVDLDLGNSQAERRAQRHDALRAFRRHCDEQMVGPGFSEIPPLTPGAQPQAT